MNPHQKILFWTPQLYSFLEPPPHFHRIGTMSVCLCVCLFDVPFHVVYFETYFAPTSKSRMSKIFRDSKSLGKSAGKKWSQK